ncbi:MAG: hypothetical protein QGF53_10280 [Alphaproteobacteria bacterium]|nr:hypothetical protein [Alphaproteobacteria bacterium]
MDPQQRAAYHRQALGRGLSRGMWLRPFAVDFDALPQDIDLSPPAALASIFFILGPFFFVMTGIPFLILAGDPELPLWGKALAAFGPLLSLAGAIVAFRRKRHRRTARFAEDGVTVAQRGYGDSTWQAAYNDFRGLSLHERILDTRYDRRVFHVLMLVHGDPDRSIPLRIDADEPPPEDVVAAYVRHTGLGILEPGSE